MPVGGAEPPVPSFARVGVFGPKGQREPSQAGRATVAAKEGKLVELSLVGTTRRPSATPANLAPPARLLVEERVVLSTEVNAAGEGDLIRTRPTEVFSTRFAS